MDEFVRQTLFMFSEKNVELTLLYVVESPSSGLQSSSLKKQIRDDLRVRGKKILKELILKFKEATEDKDFKIDAVLTEGKPADEIVRYAKEAKSDVILVGSGKEKIDKNLLGSVTEEVVHAAPCNVVLFKMPQN